MAADRPIQPSPRRLRLAWRAGLRPRSRWLGPGLMCLALAVAWAEGASWALAAWTGLWRRCVEGGAIPGRAELFALALVLAACLLAGLVVVVLESVVTGAFGAVDGQALRRLRLAPLRVPVLGTTALAAAAGCLLVRWLMPVMAGGARAVDATADALTELWQIWLVRGLTITGVVLVAAGVAELLLARDSIWRALHQSFEDARQDRDRGGSGGG